MLLFAFALCFAVVVISLSYLNRPNTSIQLTEPNVKLEEFYKMHNEPVNVQLKQLVAAAKILIKNFTRLSKQKEIVSNLYEERILSGDYYRKMRSIEEEYIIEKTIIEQEAEFLNSSKKDSVFADANKQLTNEEINKERKKLFDEAEFLKKKDLIKNNWINKVKC